jgi:hypothetical protein
MRQAYRTRAMTGSHEVHEVTVHAARTAHAAHAVSRLRIISAGPTFSVAIATFPGTLDPRQGSNIP